MVTNIVNLLGNIKIGELKFVLIFLSQYLLFMNALNEDVILTASSNV